MIWILVIAVMFLSMFVQARLKSRFAKYSEVPTSLTGAEVAQRMLQAHGIHDVNIVSVEGTLTDHYNPQNKTVNLSHDVYYGRSVAAAAVAAHECGHVVQHAVGYGPLKLRTALVPVLTFTNSWISWVLCSRSPTAGSPGSSWPACSCIRYSRRFSGSASACSPLRRCSVSSPSRWR